MGTVKQHVKSTSTCTCKFNVSFFIRTSNSSVVHVTSENKSVLYMTFLIVTDDLSDSSVDDKELCISFMKSREYHQTRNHKYILKMQCITTINIISET